MLLALLSAFASDTPEFAQVSLVLLQKGPAWSADDTEENRALMKGHLAHFGALYEQGKLEVCGPVADQADEDLRGVCIYNVPAAEAQSLAEQDPRVKAKQLEVEAVTWWHEAGYLAFPKSKRAN